MKNYKKQIKSALAGGVALSFLWLLYVCLIVFLLPELSLKAKLSIALAFAIPTVIMIGALTERIKNMKKS